MPDVLIFADTVTTPEMRHEVPVLVPDPFLYAEKDGKKITMSTAFEIERIAEAGIEAHAYEKFGYDELLAEGKRTRFDEDSDSTGRAEQAAFHRVAEK